MGVDDLTENERTALEEYISEHNIAHKELVIIGTNQKDRKHQGDPARERWKNKVDELVEAFDLASTTKEKAVEKIFEDILDEFAFLQWKPKKRPKEGEGEGEGEDKWISKGREKRQKHRISEKIRESIDSKVSSVTDPMDKGKSHQIPIFEKQLRTSPEKLSSENQIPIFREQLCTSPQKESSEDGTVLWFNPPQDNHPMVRKLDNFVNVIQKAEVRKYIEEAAGDHANKSITQINGAIQIKLNKKGGTESDTESFKEIKRRFIKKPGDQFSNENLVEFVKDHTKSAKPNLEENIFRNMAFLIRFDDAAAQPPHCETKTNGPDIPTEQFGIWNLVGGQKGTIYYNMTGVPDGPTLKDLTEKGNPWHGIVDEYVCNKVGNNQETKQLVEEFGRLAYATEDRRVDPGIVAKHSCVMMSGGHPHHAPVSKGFRAVLFFTSKHPDIPKEHEYDGDTQWSQEKLAYKLYESMPQEIQCSHIHGMNLLFMYGIYVSENIMNGGDYDITFDYDVQTGPLAGTWEPTLKELAKKFKEVREYRIAADQVQELAAQSEEKKSELEEALKSLEGGTKSSTKSIQISISAVKEELKVCRKEAKKVSAKVEKAKKAAKKAMQEGDLTIQQVVYSLIAEFCGYYSRHSEL